MSQRRVVPKRLVYSGLTLLDVVNHYDKLLNLGLTDGHQSDLVEYLKSLGTGPIPKP